MDIVFLIISTYLITIQRFKVIIKTIVCNLNSLFIIPISTVGIYPIPHDDVHLASVSKCISEQCEVFLHCSLCKFSNCIVISVFRSPS